MKPFNSASALAGLLAGLAAVLAAGGWWAREARSSKAATPVEERKESAQKTLYNCAMHPSYIQDHPGKCPFCGMDLTSMAASSEAGPDTGQVPGAAAGGRGVRIDPAAVQNIGVRTEKVGRKELAGVVRASGRIAVDEARQFAVNARVAGWAEKLHASTTGVSVRKGGTLLDLYSPDLVAAQEEYVQASRYARNLAQAGTGGSPGAGGHAAEARRAAEELLESARRRLVNWEFPAARIQALEARGTPERNVPVTSPAQGVVLEKMVVQGQRVEPGMPLYRIADLSRVWVVASVFQGDLASVRKGSPAEVSLSYLPGQAFSGQVAFVSPVLDPATRTAEVRVEVENTSALDLKPEMFATVTFRSKSAGPVVAVPEQAIIRSGRRNLAIVALGGGYFEPREVVLGRVSEGSVEVLEGLAEGEDLVVSSQFLIDSESNLKAAIQQLQSRSAADTGAP